MYIYLIPTTQSEPFQSSSLFYLEDKGDISDGSKTHQDETASHFESLSLAELSELERRSVYQVHAAGDPEDMKLFARYLNYTKLFFIDVLCVCSPLINQMWGYYAWTKHLLEDSEPRIGGIVLAKTSFFPHKLSLAQTCWFSRICFLTTFYFIRSVSWRVAHKLQLDLKSWILTLISE